MRGIMLHRHIILKGRPYALIATEGYATAEESRTDAVTRPVEEHRLPKTWIVCTGKMGA